MLNEVRNARVLVIIFKTLSYEVICLNSLLGFGAPIFLSSKFLPRPPLAFQGILKSLELIFYTNAETHNNIVKKSKFQNNE